MDEKNTNSRNYFYLVLFAVCVYACYMSWAGNVHTDGAGIDSVRSRVEQSAESNQQLERELNAAEQSANEITASIERSEGTIADAKGTVSAIENNLSIAENAVGKCQSILDGVRSRAEKGTGEP